MDEKDKNKESLMGQVEPNPQPLPGVAPPVPKAVTPQPVAAEVVPGNPPQAQHIDADLTGDDRALPQGGLAPVEGPVTGIDVLSELFETDKDQVKNGTWIDVGKNPEGEDMSFKVRPANTRTNLEYRKALQRKLKPYRRQMNAGSISAEVEMRIEVECFCKHVLIDWKGLGVSYSYDAAVDLLTRMPGLFDTLNDAASSELSFMGESREDDAGN